MARSQNFYEEVVDRAASEMKAIFPALVEGVRGGKRPPWSIQISEAEYQNLLKWKAEGEVPEGTKP